MMCSFESVIFQITHGQIWPLVYCLCLFTAVLSAILDNVTTLLLMAPVSIRLCEILQINPVPILISMIIFSNIGGSMTPVGDPPNIIIVSNSYVLNSVRMSFFLFKMFAIHHIYDRFHILGHQFSRLYRSYVSRSYFGHDSNICTVAFEIPYYK